MSDRTNATIRHILARWERIIRGALARAEAIRQRTIMDGFRAFRGWLDVRPKRLKARRNWDYFRAFGIPTVRHFLSYEKKGHYGWGGEYARNPLRAGNPVNYYPPSRGHMLNRPRWERFFWFLSLEHPYLRWGPRSRLTICIQCDIKEAHKISQSVSYFTVPPRAHPSTGSQSGSAHKMHDLDVSDVYPKCILDSFGIRVQYM